METCALITVPVAKSVAASSAAFSKLLMLFSRPNPIVRTKRRNTLGGAIFDCERCSWPHVQAVPRLRNCDGRPESIHDVCAPTLANSGRGGAPRGRAPFLWCGHNA